MKYRKRPVVIEAWQVGSRLPKPSWLVFASIDGQGWQYGNADDYADIVTLEGTMRARRHDWIIQGVQGEIYPCKPDIFAKTYEPAMPICPPRETLMSNMRDHAKAELERINFGEPDTRLMLNILDDIVAEWDSGGAMSAVAPILTKLLAFQPLSPLTGQDDEWYEAIKQEPPTLQNVRCGSVFKSLQPDGSWRAYDIDAPGDCETITFPYDPSKSRRPILATIEPGDLPEDWFEEHDGQRLVLSIEKVKARIAELEAQLLVEGEHTAAANANIDRLNTEIERVTRHQQGPLMGKD